MFYWAGTAIDTVSMYCVIAMLMLITVKDSSEYIK